MTAAMEDEMVQVFIVESERGWGQRIDEVKEFPTRGEAEKFVRDYNTKHNQPMAAAPDWYMYAELEDAEPFTPMLRHEP